MYDSALAYLIASSDLVIPFPVHFCAGSWKKLNHDKCESTMTSISAQSRK